MPTKIDVAALPGARAVARHVPISAMKARRVVNLVRGLPAKEALTVLKFAPQAASEPVYKVVASAIANAENNERLDGDSLLISEAFVDEGPTMKRFRPRAQGRAYRIRKRTCHITIVVESVVVGAPTRPAKAAAKAAPAAATVTEATADDNAAAKTTKKAAPAKAAKATKDAVKDTAEDTAEDDTAKVDDNDAAEATAEKPAKKAAKKAAAKASEPAAEEGTE